ncbi:MAG: WD40/YVTN/BNR-like repeat-containing protein [Gaiellaceae bacterium]
MIAAAGTAEGVYLVDVGTEQLVGFEAEARLEPAGLDVELPRLVAATVSGSTVVAVLDRRPPLAVSHDAGRTWREAGGGLPPGSAVAIASDNPDVIVYGARNRLYLSRDGGRFWRSLAPELPEIEALELRGDT